MSDNQNEIEKLKLELELAKTKLQLKENIAVPLEETKSKEKIEPKEEKKEKSKSKKKGRKPSSNKNAFHISWGSDKDPMSQQILIDFLMENGISRDNSYKTVPKSKASKELQKARDFWSVVEQLEQCELIVLTAEKKNEKGSYSEKSLQYQTMLGLLFPEKYPNWVPKSDPSENEEDPTKEEKTEIEAELDPNYWNVKQQKKGLYDYFAKTKAKGLKKIEKYFI